MAGFLVRWEPEESAPSTLERRLHPFFQLAAAAVFLLSLRALVVLYFSPRPSIPLIDNDYSHRSQPVPPTSLLSPYHLSHFNDPPFSCHIHTFTSPPLHVPWYFLAIFFFSLANLTNAI